MNGAGKQNNIGKATASLSVRDNFDLKDALAQMQRVHVTWVQTGFSGLSCIIYVEGFSQAGFCAQCRRKRKLTASPRSPPQIASIYQTWSATALSSERLWDIEK